MSDLEQMARRVMDQYAAAALARDAAALIRLYDPKARIFDAWGVWEYADLAQWQLAVEGWFSSHPDEKIVVSFQDVHVLGSRELAGVSATVTYAGVSAQGEQVRSMQNRISWVLRTSGHVLRIAHEHTSSPVGFEDQKAILRKPSAA